MNDRKPAFWAVLPARVRYDPGLRPNAKLLYAEITAMADATGYCWATNAYLSQLFEISPRTVRELIKSLEDRGYLQVDVRRDPKTNEVTERRIWVDRPTIMEEDMGTPSGENPPYPSGEKSPDPLAKIRHKNNTSNNIPPIVPQRGAAANGTPKRKREPKKAPDWKPDRFVAFWSYYPRGEAKQAAIRAWDKLQPDDDLLAQMGRALSIQKSSDMWQAGIGIPYASTWLNNRRWEEVDLSDNHRGDPPPAGSCWAPDPEVMG